MSLLFVSSLNGFWQVFLIILDAGWSGGGGWVGSPRLLLFMLGFDVVVLCFHITALFRFW